MRLRAAKGGAHWRDTVVESSAVLAGGIAGLLQGLTPQSRKPVARDHQALRFAKVKVAEIQLYRAETVKAGQVARDLYRRLKPQIDEARGAFQTRFLTPPNGIPDYLHQEMVRALAHNDEALLGPHYPGPLA